MTDSINMYQTYNGSRKVWIKAQIHRLENKFTLK